MYLIIYLFNCFIVLLSLSFLRHSQVYGHWEDIIENAHGFAHAEYGGTLKREHIQEVQHTYRTHVQNKNVELCVLNINDK